MLEVDKLSLGFGLACYAYEASLRSTFVLDNYLPIVSTVAAGVPVLAPLPMAVSIGVARESVEVVESVRLDCVESAEFASLSEPQAAINKLRAAIVINDNFFMRNEFVN